MNSDHNVSSPDTDWEERLQQEERLRTRGSAAGCSLAIAITALMFIIFVGVQRATESKLWAYGIATSGCVVFVLGVFKWEDRNWQYQGAFLLQLSLALGLLAAFAVQLLKALLR